MDKIVAKIIEKVIEQMSDDLRLQIIEAVEKLDIAAKESKNPWDDIVILLYILVGPYAGIYYM